MNYLLMPVRPAKTHQIIARQLLLRLMANLDLSRWEPIQEAALRDDDEKSLSADVTVFDKEENARVCIEIYKKPFSDNAKLKRYHELMDYYPDIEEVFFIVYRPLLEYYDFQIQGWNRLTAADIMETSSYSSLLGLDLSIPSPAS
jgi:hypothetical protein